MNAQEVSVNSAGAAVVSGSNARQVHQLGGAEKGGDFFSTQGPKSSGTALGREEKVGDNFSVYEVSGAAEKLGAAKSGGAPRTAVETAPASDKAQLIPTSLPAAAPIGRRTGRPRTFTPELEEKVCMLLSVGFSRRQAAAYLGIDSTTISHAAARDAELAAEFSRCEQLSDVQPEMALMAEARKNWRAAAWYMQFRAKHPRPLTEAEKEEQHRARLAEDRRSAESMQTYLNAVRGPTDNANPFSDLASPQVMQKVVRQPRKGK